MLSSPLNRQNGDPLLANIYSFMTYISYTHIITDNIFLSYTFYFASTFSALVNLFVLPYASS